MTNEHFIQTKEELETIISLTPDEELWFESRKGDSLPLRITHYYAALINPSDIDDPIRRQVVPQYSELKSFGQESSDPLCELQYSHSSRLIHRYENRVALLVSDYCAAYCRHCFRRRFTAKEDTVIGQKELESIGTYIENDKRIKEMLLTGGDPLMVSNKKLSSIISYIRGKRPDIVLRLCTRTLVTFPSRINQSLIDMLKEYSTSPIYIMTQFNHPKEITPESILAVSLFTHNGFVVMNQTVLLKGVNDNVEILEELMNNLIKIKVVPYYLFQGDMVEGTSHLRLPIQRTIEIERELRIRLSGLAMPTVAVDLPLGGGKVPISEPYYKGKIKENTHLFVSLDGREIEYIDP
jgi:lysine 2,3-aminomutase